MIDIVEILAELLRVSPSIVQQYSAKGPIEALFFIFFLPTIFLLTAFYLFFSDFINHKGVNLLLSIAVYMFIIIQGYYSIIVTLSHIWIYIIIVLMLIKVYKHHKGGSSGGGGRSRVFSTLGRQFGEKLWENITSKKDYERIVDAQIRELESLIKAVEKGNPDAIRAFGDLEPEVRRTLLKLREMEKIAGIPLGKVFDAKLRKLEKMVEEMERKLGEKND